MIIRILLVASVFFAGCAGPGQSRSPSADPLPSWQSGPAKDAITAFIEDATTENRPGFIPSPERIAVFDNDGTLWAEQPVYFQLLFAMDRVRQLAPDHPDWQSEPALKAAIDGDMAALAGSGKEGLLRVVTASHAGMTSDEFDAIARAWFAKATHRTTGRPITSMVYQPMLELLDALREAGFKTYIVSGGGVDFIRAFAEEVYGIPPEQVIGSSLETEWDPTQRAVVRTPKLGFIDDKAGKPVAIQRVIGRRPVMTVGNSDGDLQMMQWTAEGDGPRACIIVRHTDATREWAYDRDSSIGRLDEALTEASERGWTIVDMAEDWRTVFPDR